MEIYVKTEKRRTVMKRVLALIMLLAVLLPMIPAVPARAAETDNSMRAEVRGIVSNVITNYANSIYYDTAAAEAILEMGLHAVFRDGAFLNVNEGDALIASLFTANLFRTATIDAITDSILTMQKLRQPELYVSGGPQWHVYNDSFTYSGYLGTERDFSRRLGVISNCKSLYGSSTWTGGLNRNDYAMQLLIGALALRMVITQGEAENGKVVYHIRMTIKDDFDFDSDYNKVEEKGYDATLDKVLVKIGRLLDFFVIDTFDWEFVKEFRIEVPFPCDHQMGGYSWELDPETMTMRSITDGFMVNPAKTLSTVTSTGQQRYYYRLEKPIQLDHDKPWVVEYDANQLSALVLGPSSGTTSLPWLRQYSRYYIWTQKYDYIPLSFIYDGDSATVKEYTYTHHFVGTKLQDQYKYNSKHIYTYRIENVPGNGSNMIYVSVYDKDLGQQVLPPTPTTHYSIQNKGDKSRTVVSEDSNRVNGMDFVVNYIGNKSYYLSTKSLTLRIWENGENVTSCDNVTTVYKAPTCTEDGGLFHTCRECGYGYVTNVEKALGHRYGSYTSDANASCEKDGTKTACCTVCGYKDTVTDAGTATAHNVIHQSAVDATCDTPGLTAGSYCDRCYTVYEEQKTIPAPGHNWMEADCDTPKTCGACGLTEGEPAGHKEVAVPGTPATCISAGITDGTVCGVCGQILTAQVEIPLAEDAHSWQDATCLISATCSRCGAVEGEALGHSEEILAKVEPTCLESGLTEGLLCSRCGVVTLEQEVINPLGHAWMEATCEAPMTCARCGAVEGEAHAHNEIPVPAVTATCVNTGLTEGIACADCGIVILPQTVVDALGHVWLDATCEAPMTCERCEVTDGEALGHSEMVTTGTTANCTETGFTDGTVCLVCESILVHQEEIPALGHTWLDATCTQPQTCSVCSATQGDVAPHEVVIDEGKAPTCTNTGLTDGSHCGACDALLDEQKEIPAKGHEWREATCTSPDMCTRCGALTGVAKGHDPVVDAKIEATCTETGLTEGSHCAECSAVLMEQKTLEALGHDWKKATCEDPKTCARCKTTEGKALGHVPEKGAKKNATCTADGHTGITRCKTCSAVLELAKTVPATGHKDANKDAVCDACGAKLTTKAPETSTEPTMDSTIEPTQPKETKPLLIMPAPQQEENGAADPVTEATEAPVKALTDAPERNSGFGGAMILVALLALAGIGVCLVLLKKQKK